MRVLYLECNMGAAGDMLMSALAELLPDTSAFEKSFNALNIPNVTISIEESVKCGISGTHIRVLVGGKEENEHIHAHHHHHSSLLDIENIINGLNLSSSVKNNACSVYKLIAEAESKVHGCEIGDIHFHEVGTMDAVADVVGVCMLLEELSPDKLIASPICTGFGEVHCAHGILPVPAPATAELLQGVPTYGGLIKGELCTPTGAALLKHFVSEFAVMPTMTVEKIGYGMGSHDFETANCVRAMLGETSSKSDTVVEFKCNIDDMTGEEIGYAMKKIFCGGALDVYTVPISMKKNRPGVLLCCMCHETDREEIIRLIFMHTTTIGVREQISNRYILQRTEEKITTEYGEIRAKKSFGFGTVRLKPEYDDLERLADENNISLRDIRFHQDTN